MYNSLTLVPAYGRDYKSKGELALAWQAGQDFMAYGAEPFSNGYCSIRDIDTLKENGTTHLHFRYNKQTLVHVVKL